MNKQSILAGDFNIDIGSPVVIDGSENFLNKLSFAHFIPCITRPTRINNNSATIIDRIWINSLTKLVPAATKKKEN